MAKVQWIGREKKRQITIPAVELIRAKLKPTKPQTEFLSYFDQREADYVAFIGGVGSGKSHLGAHRVLEMAARNPDVRGFIAANTYPQLWQSTLTALYKVCKEYGVPVSPDKPESAAKKKVLYLWNRVEVLCRSAERYSEWDGTEVGWFWLDEAKTMPAGVWGAINERHRDIRCDQLCGWLSTTPDGMNWLSDLTDDPSVRMVNSLTSDNQENLPPKYVDGLRRKMSPEMFAQQCEGKFINTTSGNCYPNFSRIENGGNFSASGKNQVVGIDFNVAPGMHSYLMEFSKESVTILDEIYIKGGDTPSLADEIEKRYGTEVALCPDAAGGQRSTTGTSDHQILRDRGFSLINRARNPAIKDRINSVNGRIFNSLGERNLFVDKNCIRLIKDLERCTWEVLMKAGYAGDLTHSGAAIGYAIEQKFPFSGNVELVKLSGFN